MSSHFYIQLSLKGKLKDMYYPLPNEWSELDHEEKREFKIWVGQEAMEEGLDTFNFEEIEHRGGTLIYV